MTNTAQAVGEFIARWQGVTASELSSAQSFVIELCNLLGVPRPHPTPEQDYMFERPITFKHGDGSQSAGRVDCYRRGAFVLESKKLKASVGAAAGLTTKGFDEALLRARSQAENYARALPATEGRPPFVVVVDVGHVIELYAEFTRSGSTYTPFPDPRSHRIRLADLARDDIRERLALLWTDPLALDPSRISARVTRLVAVQLAELAKSLESSGHRPEVAAGFLTRCLFSMFAEDVELLPKLADGAGGTVGAFAGLLTQHRDNPAVLQRMLQALWTSMDAGGFSPALANDVLRFNGKLFKGAAADGYSLRLTTAQIDGLLRAAAANWREVEPAIFGTLLERALNPDERHALGAHYTPRAYVERLVLPTVMDPLRADWANAQAAALLLAREAEGLKGKKHADKMAEARAEIGRFHHQLCTTRVLDPACGSGNFLYVTLEHLKRLEGEVNNQLDALGRTQDKLAFEGETVTLQQLRGIEINPRAAALAELVLWIGWLQWHVRTLGVASVAEPVVHDYGNIECRDAVLAYDRVDLALGADGRPITRWDGKGFKTHSVTGEQVPDDAAQVAEWAYINPRQAEWPKVDFIVGNPPFIGKLRMREALGDGYVTTLRDVYPSVPDSADFVMYWWNKAAETVAQGQARQFGLITTNSLSMTYNRRVVNAHLTGKPPIHLAFAIPDHPWVDSAQGAAVRIAMTVGASGNADGLLQSVVAEDAGGDDAITVSFTERHGEINEALSLGPNVSKTHRLAANARLSAMGMILVGAGFIVEPGDPLLEIEPARIRRYLNGKDLTQSPRGVHVIDLYGLTIAEVRQQFPACYQRLYERVKPERDASKDKSLRENWWLFRRTNVQLREAIGGLNRYIGTTETAKHRLFSFIPGFVTPDQKIRVVGSDDAFVLGVLSSDVHVDWALAAGGRLGVGNDPVYNNTTCFEKFPFPAEDTGLTPNLTGQIRNLAEHIDAHRKARQAAHEAVTLTGLYNVLAKLRSGEALTPKDKQLHELGLVSVLRTLHDELDWAVLQAYGWADLGPVPWAPQGDDGAHTTRQAWTETLLERLVALNARRAADEAQGLVRWLRPEFQDPVQRAALLATAATAATAATEAAAAAAAHPVQAEIDTGPAQPAAGAHALGVNDTDNDTDNDANADTEGRADGAPAAPGAPAAAASRRPWPAELPAQMRAVADTLATTPGSLTEAALAERFTGRGPWKKRLPQILETLEAVGRARVELLGGTTAWRAA